MLAIETLCSIAILAITFSVQTEMAEWQVDINRRLFFNLREVVYGAIPSFCVSRF